MPDDRSELLHGTLELLLLNAVSFEPLYDRAQRSSESHGEPRVLGREGGRP